MKKKLLIIASAIVVVVAAAALYFWSLMGKPLYEPGMVRAEKNLQASLEPPAQSSDTSNWEVEPGMLLHHFASGAGKSVLMVHGGPGYPFHEPLPALQSLLGQYRFIYYDQRGCGKSTRPFDRFASSNYYANMTTLERTLGLGAQLADIERIRRILGEEKLVLCGHSFGAFIAALYAAEFPERISALILVAPASVLVMPSEGGGLFEEVRQRLPEDKRQEYSQFIERYMDFGKIFTKSEQELVALQREFGEYYAAVTPVPAIMPTSEGGLADAGGWMVYAMYFSMGREHDYREALKNITAPALVIHGANDLQPESESRLYADLLSNAKFEVIPGASHFPFHDQPEAFAQIIGQFLSRVE